MPDNRAAFSIVEWLVVLTILAILVALLLPANRRSPEAARRSQCKNNLKQIVVALQNYEAEWGVLPPASTADATGARLHSWRTLILPYLGEQALYRAIDLTKPWDHEVNATARNTHLPVYRCTSRAVRDPSATTYLAVVATDSCLAPANGLALSEITADPHDTLMVVEAGPHHAVPWMAPVDADESLLEKLRPDDAQPHRGGLQVGYVDGSVRFLSIETSHEEWLRLISCNENDD